MQSVSVKKSEVFNLTFWTIKSFHLGEKYEFKSLRSDYEFLGCDIRIKKKSPILSLNYFLYKNYFFLIKKYENNFFLSSDSSLEF